MPLTAGDKLGPYEILSLIGKGGMGEVYRAHDSRVGRDVAVKVSADKFSERFGREARAIASLNHPNICQLYDIGPNFLVMELIEGESPRGPLPLEEALHIARQITDALDYAHEKGVVHRDLKPGNIKIKPDGVVKVLDFGLAKISATPATPTEDSPTFSMAATQAGVILGTAAYMAPEQARGKVVDKRADIWAFGVLLHELLTGKRPFQGEDITEILASVVKEQPDLGRVPAQVRPLIARCLEKDPKKRLRDIGDAFALLDEDARSRSPRHQRLPWVVAGTLAIVSGVALWATWRGSRATEQPLVRLNLDLAPPAAVSVYGGDVILSPDGTRLVYVTESQRLFTRRLDQPAATELPGTDGATLPFFSPDGQWVAFFAGRKLKKVSVQSGEVTVLCDASAGVGGSWGDDGTIIAGLNQVGKEAVLWRIPEAGGKPVPVTELNRERGESTHRHPQILPGGKAVLFTASTATSGLDGADIEVVRLGDAHAKTLGLRGTYPSYIASEGAGAGHLIYVRLGTLFAVPFDAERMELRGSPSPLVENVAYSGAGSSAQFTVSRSGTLVYRTGGPLSQMLTVQWLDGAGNTQPLLPKPADYLYPNLSPDGNRLAVATEGDIWVYEPQRDIMTRLTSDKANTYPLWSPDGRYIVFQERGGMSWTHPDGAAKPQSLTQTKSLQFPWSFTADGKRLAFIQMSAETGYDIWTASVESNDQGLRIGTAEPFLQTPADERHPAFSRDGRWLAYTANDSDTGSMEVYVRTFPNKGRKWQISTSGGGYPIWSRNGRELFFLNIYTSEVMVTTYTVKGDEFVPDKPRVWSGKRIANVGLRAAYDLAPDGKRIAALMPAEAPGAQKAEDHVNVLLNFFDEVRRRAPVGK